MKIDLIAGASPTFIEITPYIVVILMKQKGININ